MTQSFDQVIVDVKQRFAELCESPKHSIAKLPKTMPEAGIYLFSEGDRALYVGRTGKLRNRLRYHTRNNHNQATFAFLLAREETGRLKASYQPKGSRQDLLTDPTFRAAFDRARERIKTMDVQWVEEKDPIRQTILEVFTAFQTDAQYNNFENH